MRLTKWSFLHHLINHTVSLCKKIISFLATKTDFTHSEGTAILLSMCYLDFFCVPCIWFYFPFCLVGPVQFTSALFSQLSCLSLITSCAYLSPQFDMFFPRLHPTICPVPLQLLTFSCFLYGLRLIQKNPNPFWFVWVRTGLNVSQPDCQTCEI